uniref:Uncharacterized protein n=1 Tax=Ditylenchus dipsaci TaxID=166011 RepID=A0A915E8M3_9BILA
MGPGRPAAPRKKKYIEAPPHYCFPPQVLHQLNLSILYKQQELDLAEPRALCSIALEILLHLIAQELHLPFTSIVLRQPCLEREKIDPDVDEAILQALQTINTLASDLSPLAQSVEGIFKRISATGDKKNLLVFKKDIQKLLDEYEEWLVDNE